MKARKTIEIKNPEAPMTSKQTYKLMMVTGVTLYYMDVYPYTIQEASDLIDRAMNGDAYRVRVELAQHEGAKVSWEDVGKDYRDDTKPRGYKASMEMLTGEEEVEEEAEEGDDEDEIQLLKARLAELEASKTPAPVKNTQPQGTTKAQKRAALQRKAEKQLRKDQKEHPEPPPAKKKSSDDNGKAKRDAVIELLAEQSGLDVNRIKALQKAFQAIS